MDGLTYFIIRTIGQDLPSSIIPFGSGLFTTTMLSIYMIVSNLFFPSNPESTEEVDPPIALLLAFIGCVIGWLALEFMVIGLRMSKSALASYGEQVGVVVPFLFDYIAFCRPFLKTDWIAVCLILTLEIIMATQSLRKKGEEIGKEEESDSDQLDDQIINAVEEDGIGCKYVR